MSNTTHLKFRAWSEHRGMWYSDTLSNDDNPCHVQIYNGGIMWGVYDSVMGNRLYTGEYDKLMQFSGFKDKHSKEIYGGDIVRYSHWNTKTGYGPMGTDAWRTGVVEYAGGRFVVTGNELWDTLTYINIEVIGNIYETPQLISQPQHESS